MNKYLPLLLLPLAASAQTTYNLDFTANGTHVIGSITLAQGTTGAVVASEINQWSMQSITNFPFSYQGSGATCADSCGLTVSGSNLVLSAGQSEVTFAQSPSQAVFFENGNIFGAPLGGGRGDFGIQMDTQQIGSDPPGSNGRTAGSGATGGSMIIFNTSESHTGGGGALELFGLLMVMGARKMRHAQTA